VHVVARQDWPSCRAAALSAPQLLHAITKSRSSSCTGNRFVLRSAALTNAALRQQAGGADCARLTALPVSR
jgi:hypothetical protein